MNSHNMRNAKGFTLIEVLVVIGIIAILAAIVIIAINPARQFAQARDSQRTSNVQAILNAIGQNIADNKGIFTCPTSALPATATDISKAAINIRPCIVPTYIAEIPYDPGTKTGPTGDNTCVDTVPGDCAAPMAPGKPVGSYDTTYTVKADATTGRITVSAPKAELITISITR